MSKTTGLGDNLLVAGYNVSGDIGSLEEVRGGHEAWESTGIDKSAKERLGLLRDGGMKFTSYFNPSDDQAHEAFSSLPRTDVVLSYLRGTTIGNAAACLIGKQINYDPKRGDDGSLTLVVEAQANGYGLEWGTQLTAGLRTDTTATNGAGVDLVGSTSFGWQAYLQVTAFTGTDVTITLQDSANNSAFATFTGSAFTATTAAQTFQRLASSSPTATVRQYVRAVTSTSGGFTSVTFNVVFVKNYVSVVF
jgi:hypothetical protein